MEEILKIDGSKEAQYQALLPQIRAVVEGEPDAVANMANIAAALKEQFNWLWVGFYRVINEELVLGPFQGPIACTRIALGRGVCGTSWKEARTLVVPDVTKFPGHIACNSLSRSEIVVPVYNKKREVIGVLDVDHHLPEHFDDTDQKCLEEVVALLS